MLLAESPQVLHHRPHRQLSGPGAGDRLVAIDEEELVNAVCRGGQQVTSEPKHVAVPGVEAGDRPPAHQVDLVGDRET